jgi:hypothetical protein
VLIESLALSALATGAGLLLSQWTLAVLLAFLADLIPTWVSFTPDARFLFFCLCIIVGTAVVSGLLPAWHAAGDRHIPDLLQAGGLRTTAPRTQRRILHALASGQIALALTLLIGAGLLGRALHEAQRIDPGFRTQDLLAYTLSAGSNYQGREQWHAFFRDHLERVRALPGVRNAALIYGLPLTGRGDEERIVTERGRQVEPGGEPRVIKHLVSPGYLETMAVRLAAGRAFTEEDGSRPGDIAVAVSESLAKYYWPERGPIGQRLRLADSKDTWFQVVGVTQDVRHEGLDQATCMELYIPCTSRTCDRSIRTWSCTRRARRSTWRQSSVRSSKRPTQPCRPPPSKRCRTESTSICGFAGCTPGSLVSSPLRLQFWP